MAIISDADLKTHLGIGDDDDDTTVGTAVSAANQAIELHCGRTFDADAEVSARTFTPLTDRWLEVDDFHTTTGLIVATDLDDDGTFEETWDATDYELESSRLLSGPFTALRAVESRTFPRGLQRYKTVQVTAQWGWAAVPAAVKQAALIKASRLFRRKDSPEGVAGFNEFGVVRVMRIDPDVEELLVPFVKMGGKGAPLLG